MSFVTYGPFADEYDVVACLSTSDVSTDVVLSRTSKWKAGISENADVYSGGFTFATISTWVDYKPVKSHSIDSTWDGYWKTDRVSRETCYN